MSRAWPIPRPQNTFHAIGDIQGAAITRLNILLADIERASVPAATHRVTLGDCTTNSAPEHDAYFLAFKDRMPDLLPVVGNHDRVGRTPTEAAAVLGMPALNHVVDMGHSVLIIIGPDDTATPLPLVYGPDTLNWVDAQLQAHAGRTCIIAAHPPLYNTVLRPPAWEPTSRPSTDASFYAYGASGVRDETIRAVIADNPNCKAWVSGHTHSHTYAPDIVKAEPIGGHTVAAINTSAVLNPGSDLSPNTGIATAFVSVLDDRIEVRWRDHGAHQWIGCGQGRQPVATVVIA